MSRVYIDNYKTKLKKNIGESDYGVDENILDILDDPDKVIDKLMYQPSDYIYLTILNDTDFEIIAFCFDLDSRTIYLSQRGINSISIDWNAGTQVICSATADSFDFPSLCDPKETYTQEGKVYNNLTIDLKNGCVQSFEFIEKDGLFNIDIINLNNGQELLLYLGCLKVEQLGSFTNVKVLEID